MEPSYSDNRLQLLHKLSPWTDALRGKLFLPIYDEAPHSTELVEKLWIQLRVPPTTIEDIRWVPQATLVREHIQWVQALRLLDLLASVDKLTCWELIVDLCDAREKLRTLGCPLEFLIEVRPRFELLFDERVPPTDHLMTALLNGDQSDGEDGRESLATVIAYLRMRRDLHGVPRLGPTSLRLHFTLRARRTCWNCRTSGCTALSMSYLTQVLPCASRVASVDATLESHFTVQSFGFDLRQVCVSNRLYELLRQVGCKIPLHTLKYNQLTKVDVKTYPPFLWRMLAPHDNARAHLGLRSLNVHSLNEGDMDNAMWSAIHLSRTLEELSLLELSSTLFDFQLFSKTAQHKIHTVHVDFGEHLASHVTFIQRALDRENNLQDGYHPTQWPPKTVRVNAQTKIHIDPNQCPIRKRPTTVYHGKRHVDCLLIGEERENTIKILVPGVGVKSVAQKDVISQQPAVLRDTHPIRTLTLSLTSRNDKIRGMYGWVTPAHPFDAASVVALLQLIGAPLEQLTLISDGDRPRDPLRLDTMLAHCPNLKRLKLVNLTLSAEQLFVSRHGHELQSLTLLRCHLIDRQRRMGCTFYVAPSVFPRLTSLYFDSTGAAECDDVPELPTVYDYILELASLRRLHRLVVRCRDAKQRARFAPWVARFDGQLIPVLPLREKLAFLSVVSVGSSASAAAKYALTTDVAVLIFEMASTTMWQRRVWTLLT